MFFGLIDFHPVVTVVYFHFVGPWCHFTSFLKNIDSPLSLNDPWSIYQSQNTSGPAETKDCDGSETWDKVALISQAVKGFIDTGLCHVFDEDSSAIGDNAELSAVSQTSCRLYELL